MLSHFVVIRSENLGLSEPSYFYYLNQSGVYKVDGTDDRKEFEATMVSTLCIEKSFVYIQY